MRKLIFILPAVIISGKLFSQNVGVGTTNPKYNLHVHKSTEPAGSDVSINITNSVTGDGFLSGARLRMLDNDFDIINNQATGTLGFSTGNFQRLLIKPNGNIGINNTDPQTVLHVNAHPFPATNYNEAIRIGGTTPYISFYDGAVLKGYVQASLGGFEIGTKSAQTLNFYTNDLQRMTVLNNGNVAIGTNTPASNGKLHVHDDIANQDASILLTNSLTGPANLRGGRIRFLNSDLILYNYEATGKFHIYTNFNSRLTVDAAGNVGIGTTNPAHKLQIENSNTSNAVNVLQNGDDTRAIAVNSTGINTHGLYLTNTNNANFASNYIVGIHSRIGNGGLPILFPGSTSAYGVIGESLSTQSGIGVFGVSNSASPGMIEAGVVGRNWGSGANTDIYGVIGVSSGVSGAGVAGRSFIATTPGILGFGEENNATAIRAEIKTSFSGTALEIKNGSLKVSGASKPVFQLTAVTGPGGNTSGNTLTIPNTTQANAATDLLIVTPVYVTVYLNKPIGVWWDGIKWNIFTQDLSNMPNGAIFNVMVVKQ